MENHAAREEGEEECELFGEPPHVEGDPFHDLLEQEQRRPDRMFILELWLHLVLSNHWQHLGHALLQAPASRLRHHVGQSLCNVVRVPHRA